MAELYRFTDKDGYTVCAYTDEWGLVIDAWPEHQEGRLVCVELSDDEGPRLLAALQRHHAPVGLDESLVYWREKLVRLDRMITEGAESPYPALRDAAELRRPERAHLAVLLRTLGMDIEELDEKEQRDG